MSQTSERKVEFLKSEKGKDRLVFQNHIFYFERKNAVGKKFWKCSKYQIYKCKARVHTRGNAIETHMGVHSHTVDPSVISAAQAYNNIKKDAEEWKVPVTVFLLIRQKI